MAVIEKKSNDYDLQKVQHLIIHNKFIMPQVKSEVALILFKKQNGLLVSEEEEKFFEEILSFIDIPQ